MIAAMDELLRQWAREYHPPRQQEEEPHGQNMIARLMDCKGVLIRGSPGGKVLTDRGYDIELIVTRQLSEALRFIVLEHYTNYDSLEEQKVSACRISRATYYRRLHEAHLAIAQLLLERAA
ncbi:hypothetical protein C4K68_07700 [Pokkaliibacter plantistimulans]|uniref:Uncharacterized protein n=1 Tax=Proteobacteria bacterium 228 TaxID=2083153 RepID=A0A2S5KSU3_9PROT|nr:hypothetical protein [Pokkaliibacter plantistimulans]PPC77921.1 hypothetical protein C4K68_07700 [Pokkaliibacter plantistimulans]